MMEVGVTACGSTVSHQAHDYMVEHAGGSVDAHCDGQTFAMQGSIQIPQPERVRVNIKPEDVRRIEALSKGMSAIGLDPENPGSVGDVLARCGELAERYQRGLDNQLAAINRLQARIATLEGHVQVHHSELHEAYDDAEPWVCDFQETK